MTLLVDSFITNTRIDLAREFLKLYFVKLNRNLLKWEREIIGVMDCRK